MIFNDKEDFEVIYTKGSGPGGQHRNKVETACTIKHIATGIKQSCQSTRSKIKNYELAMKILKSKLLAMESNKKHETLNGIRRETIWDESNGSNVIRTYNSIRNEVKDHRTKKTAPLKDMLNGKVDLIKLSND
jgi:protein subunit release factor A